MVNRSSYPNPNTFRDGRHPTTHRETSTQRSGETCKDMNAVVQKIGLGGLAIITGVADCSASPEDIGNIRGFARRFVARESFDPRRRL